MFWKSNKPSRLDADSAWKKQNEKEAHPLYQYINLQKQGRLIEVYEQQGLTAVERIISTELKSFLYNGGRGKTVTKTEYIRWKTKLTVHDSTEVELLTDEQLLKLYDETSEHNKKDKNDDGGQTEAEFTPHDACWDIMKRGAVGETALHLCVLLSNNDTFRQLTLILLRVFPRLSLDYYEGEEYYGESCLHIAIVYNDFELVKLLVTSGANVNQRATGRFFLPEDQKKGRTKKTDYNGYAYYGEYPLAFAASLGHMEIYNYLLDHGADPNLQDSFGNTVLHMTVIANQVSMFTYAVQHSTKQADMQILNEQNLTPLTLASRLGRYQLFNIIMQLQSYEVWRYSNITCSVYPLAPLDTIGKDGEINWSSALIYVTDGDTDAHLQLVDGGVIYQLLADKWKTFARKRFFQRLLLAVLHLITLSIAIYTRPNQLEYIPTTPPDAETIVRYTSEVIVCVDCAAYLILDLIEIRLQGVLGFIKNQTSAPAKCIFNISCILILTCIPMRLLNQQTAERILLAFAAPMAWAILLFFARGYKFCGVIVVVFYQMLKGDLYRFGIIYVIFLIGFTECFYFLFKGYYQGGIPTDFSTIAGTIMRIFIMSLGEFKINVLTIVYDNFMLLENQAWWPNAETSNLNNAKSDISACPCSEEEKYYSFDGTVTPELTKAVFILFAILVPILLLNMLIAMMANTYERIIRRSEKEWKRQWAKIIIVLERTYSHKQLLKFQEQYSMKFAKSADDSERGLMVIKTSTATKARQRKGAIANWKRITHRVILTTRHSTAADAAARSAMPVTSSQNSKLLTTVKDSIFEMAMSQLQDWKVDQDHYADSSQQLAADDVSSDPSSSVDTADKEGNWAGSLFGKMQKIAQSGFARTNRIEPLHSVANSSAKPEITIRKSTKSPSSSEKELIEKTSEDVVTSTESLR